MGSRARLRALAVLQVRSSQTAQRGRGDVGPLFIVSAAALSAMAGPQRCQAEAQDWASNIRTAEPTLPARKTAIRVVANGKRCSSAKSSAASAERLRNMVMAL